MLKEKSVGTLNNLIGYLVSTTRPPFGAPLTPVPAGKTRLAGGGRGDRYLVDPASSHMLVLKTKPCKSMNKYLYSESADGSLKQLSFI